MSAIGRNDQCPCGSGKKYKKCCLITQEKTDQWANKLANDDFEKWFAEDEKIGLQNIAAADANPPPDPVSIPADLHCPECNQIECACDEV